VHSLPSTLFFEEIAVVKNLFLISALAVSLFVFGTGRPGFLEQDHAVIGGEIAECNVGFYEIEECHGDLCPDDFKNYYYKYWDSENLVVIATKSCAVHNNLQNLPCAGDAQHDSVHGNCQEFFWDWVLP